MDASAQTKNSLSKGCDEVVTNNNCEPCYRDNIEQEPAGFCLQCNEYMCSECIRYHRRNRASKQHIITSEEDMPAKKPDEPPAPVTDTDTEVCTTHTRENIRYYCCFHKVLGCTLCVTTDHKNCKDVKYISDLTYSLLGSQEFNNLARELGILKDEIQSAKNDTKENIRQSETFADKVIESVRDLKQRTADAFDTLELEMRETMKKIKAKDHDKMNILSETLTKASHDLENVSSNMNYLKQSGQLNRLFMLMKRSTNTTESCKSILKQVEPENRICKYWFEVGSKMQEILDKVSEIGTLQKDDERIYHTIK